MSMSNCESGNGRGNLGQCHVKRSLMAWVVIIPKEGWLRDFFLDFFFERKFFKISFIFIFSFFFIFWKSRCQFLDSPRKILWQQNSFIGPGISCAAPWPWNCLVHSMIFIESVVWQWLRSLGTFLHNAACMNLSKLWVWKWTRQSVEVSLQT